MSKNQNQVLAMVSQVSSAAPQNHTGKECVSDHSRVLILSEHEPLAELMQTLLLLSIPQIQLQKLILSPKSPLVLTSAYDLIIVDGVNLVPKIEAIQRLQPKTPILFVSGMCGNRIEYLQRHGLEVFGTIGKPFEIPELCENVCHALKIPVVNGWEQAAEDGDAEAAARHGLNLFWGKWSPPDLASAFKWFQKAALAGSGKAQNLYSVCMLGSFGTSVDQEKGLRWLQYAAAQKNHVAEFNLGCWYAFGPEASRSREAAIHWFELAAKAGVHLSGLFLCQLHGTKGQPDEQNSFMEYIGQMLLCDLNEAVQEIGIPLIDPDRLARLEGEAAEAFAQLSRAAKAGNAVAQYYYGRCMAEGSWGLAKDADEVLEWYYRSADQGYAKAMVTLGHHYANKRSPIANTEAFFWFTVAKQCGDDSVTQMREKIYNFLRTDQKAGAMARADAFMFGLKSR